MTPARYQRHFLKALALIHSVTCWIYELAIMSISPLDFPKSSWLSKWTDIAWYGTYNVAWCLHSPKMRNQSFYGKFWRPAEAGMIQELISRVLLDLSSQQDWHSSALLQQLMEKVSNCCPASGPEFQLRKPSQGRVVLPASGDWGNNTQWRMFAGSLTGKLCSKFPVESKNRESARLAVQARLRLNANTYIGTRSPPQRRK